MPTLVAGFTAKVLSTPRISIVDAFLYARDTISPLCVKLSFDKGKQITLRVNSIEDDGEHGSTVIFSGNMEKVDEKLFAVEATLEELNMRLYLYYNSATHIGFIGFESQEDLDVFLSRLRRRWA